MGAIWAARHKRAARLRFDGCAGTGHCQACWTRCRQVVARLNRAEAGVNNRVERDRLGSGDSRAAARHTENDKHDKEHKSTRYFFHGWPPCGGCPPVGAGLGYCWPGKAGVPTSAGGMLDTAPRAKICSVSDRASAASSSGSSPMERSAVVFVTPNSFFAIAVCTDTRLSCGSGFCQASVISMSGLMPLSTRSALQMSMIVLPYVHCFVSVFLS